MHCGQCVIAPQNHSARNGALNVHSLVSPFTDWAIKCETERLASDRHDAPASGDLFAQLASLHLRTLTVCRRLDLHLCLGTSWQSVLNRVACACWSCALEFVFVGSIPDRVTVIVYVIRNFSLFCFTQVWCRDPQLLGFYQPIEWENNELVSAQPAGRLKPEGRSFCGCRRRSPPSPSSPEHIIVRSGVDYTSLQELSNRYRVMREQPRKLPVISMVSLLFTCLLLYELFF